MAKHRTKKSARMGRPRTLGPPDPPVDPSPSLPGEISATLAVVDPPVTYDPDDPTTAHLKPSWWLPPDSEVGRKGMHIVSLRIMGMEDADIARELKISPKSIAPYVYRAAKNGYIKNWDNPKAEVQNALLPKVIKNLHAMVDDTRVVALKTVGQETSMKLFELTLAKDFGDENKQQAPQTMVAIRIEMPAGPVQQMREDTTGGVPAYSVIDAEVK